MSMLELGQITVNISLLTTSTLRSFLYKDHSFTAPF